MPLALPHPVTRAWRELRANGCGDIEEAAMLPASRTYDPDVEQTAVIGRKGFGKEPTSQRLTT
jgi:hypothetical protein